MAQRIMEEVNEGFNARFDRFEQALKRLTTNSAPAPRQISPPRSAVTRSQKRSMDSTTPNPSLPRKVSKTSTQSVSSVNSHSSSYDNDVNHEPVFGRTPVTSQRQSQQATPHHPSGCFADNTSRSFAENSSQAGQDNRHSAVTFLEKEHSSDSRSSAYSKPDTGISSSWAAWSTAHQNRPSSTTMAPILPTSTHDPGFYSDVDAQVKHLLATTAHNLGKGNSQPYDFPYKYILRGPEKIKATINSVTLPNIFGGSSE